MSGRPSTDLVIAELAREGAFRRRDVSHDGATQEPLFAGPTATAWHRPAKKI
jgi:hypothetical protein